MATERLAVGSPDKVLLLVDIQNDFCEGGSLPVAGSAAIFPVVNQWIDKALAEHWLIVASRDWHPVDHCSFRQSGGPWPQHCVQDSPGARFHPAVKLPDSAIRVSKGSAFDVDAYSAFDGTGLASFLRRRGVTTVYVAGLALDVCVRATVLDALRNGFGVVLIGDATRAVDGAAAAGVIRELQEAGARLHPEPA